MTSRGSGQPPLEDQNCLKVSCHVIKILIYWPQGPRASTYQVNEGVERWLAWTGYLFPHGTTLSNKQLSWTKFCPRQCYEPPPLRHLAQDSSGGRFQQFEFDIIPSVFHLGISGIDYQFRAYVSQNRLSTFLKWGLIKAAFPFLYNLHKNQSQSINLTKYSC